MNYGSVHNYFERLVFDEIAINAARYQVSTPDILEDIACVALNRLPPRYIRHDIDLAFYLTSQERESIEASVRDAVRDAANYVLARSRVREYNAAQESQVA
jgi:hypothetical protein